MARAAAALLLGCIWLQLATATANATAPTAGLDQVRAVNASSRPAQPLTVDPVTGEIAATATWYTYPSGGNSCHLSGAANNGMCVAPSDGFAALWNALVPSGQQCTKVAPFTGPCSSCGNKVRLYAAPPRTEYLNRIHISIVILVLFSLLFYSRVITIDSLFLPLGQPLPTCPYSSLCKTAAGAPKYFCVRCADTNGACVHTDLVRVYVADACPTTHPCNTCDHGGEQGNLNPCANGVAHIDLCQCVDSRGPPF